MTVTATSPRTGAKPRTAHRDVAVTGRPRRGEARP